MVAQMPNFNLAAKIPPRELAIVAYQAGMTDASISEVGKYAILRMAGYPHDEAKGMALALRGSHSIDDGEKVVGIRMPIEWVEMARANVPEHSDNTSYLLRYSLARLTSSENEAREIAGRKIGRPRKAQIA